MHMVKKGAPHFVKRSDGKYELLVPIEIEFESEAEAQEVERAMQEHMDNAFKALREGR